MGAVESLVALGAEQLPQRTAELTVGTIANVDRNQCVWVDYDDNPYGIPLVAICAASVTMADVGRDVVLAFAQGDPGQPILLGLLRRNLIKNQTEPGASVHAVELIRETGNETPHVHLEAAEAVTLKCGQASLTLNRDGRVIVRGTNVATYADGTLRLRGAVVELN